MTDKNEQACSSNCESCKSETSPTNTDFSAKPHELSRIKKVLTKD